SAVHTRPGPRSRRRSAPASSSTGLHCGPWLSASSPPTRLPAGGAVCRNPWHIFSENGWRILTENLQRPAGGTSCVASRGSAPPRAPSRTSLRALERGPQERGNFFLNLHQRLGPLGALLPPHDLALLLSNRLVARIGRRRLRTPRLGREPRELAPIPRRAPSRQVRRVKP